MDQETFDLLSDLHVASIVPLAEASWMTPELAEVRSARSKGEFCWTTTPFAPSTVFAQDTSIQRVTYVDADLWFRASPEPIFNELTHENKSVLITEHAYNVEDDYSATSGIYCVQFMVFVRDASDKVLSRWQQQCIEWCFSRFEDGKFGDQMYLNTWPITFPREVHVLQNRGRVLGPWASRRYPYSDALVYHFHGLKFLKGGKIYLGEYSLPQPLVMNVYLPYLEELANTLSSTNLSLPVQRGTWQMRFWIYIRAREYLKKCWSARPYRQFVGRSEKL